MPTGPNYEYAEEVHLTAFVRDNTASYSEAARDAGGAAGMTWVERERERERR